MCSAPPNGCRDTQHPTWRKKEELFNGDQVVGRQKPGCIPPGVLLRYLWRLLFNVSSDLYDFFWI